MMAVFVLRGFFLRVTQWGMTMKSISDKKIRLQRARVMFKQMMDENNQTEFWLLERKIIEEILPLLEAEEPEAIMLFSKLSALGVA